jgi:signal transduction histidine kinase
MIDYQANPASLDILVVDDTRAHLRHLVEILTGKGYNVRPVLDGQSALIAVQADPPDLILLDVNMPDMDGLQVCRQLKADAHTRDIPVIFISAFNEVIDKVTAFAAGGVDYVTKPFDADEVLARVETHLTLRNLQKDLQQKNVALSGALRELKGTQEQLIQSEKLAALGGLVAGIAHEINTPIGISVTAASYLDLQTEDLVSQYVSNNLKKSELEHYVQTAKESSEMILTNLKRADNLIHSFKQIAVDQSTEGKRHFHLKEYLNNVLLSLQPRLRKTSHRITVNCPEDLEITSYPGAISQIITNLVMNSLVHGFEDLEQGKIIINISINKAILHFHYSDDGKGIQEEHLPKIFNPFFTTKRSQGRSGLGMHIVYNLVTQTLKGTIECTSTPGAGTTFLIHFPVERRKIT